MCWICKEQNIKIAEQDIPIFKIMKETPYSETVKSIYQDFPYILNSLTESDIKIKEIPYREVTLFEVNEALHSYNPEKVKCLRNSSMIYIEISTGFNDSKKLDWFIDEDEDIIKVEGFIPKGSKYMENTEGEYVSNQLILKEVKSLV